MERRGMHKCMSCVMMVAWQWVRELLKGFSEFQVGIKLTTPVVPDWRSNH